MYNYDPEAYIYAMTILGAIPIITSLPLIMSRNLQHMAWGVVMSLLGLSVLLHAARMLNPEAFGTFSDMAWGAFYITALCLLAVEAITARSQHKRKQMAQTSDR